MSLENSRTCGLGKEVLQFNSGAKRGYLAMTGKLFPLLDETDSLRGGGSFRPGLACIHYQA